MIRVEGLTKDFGPRRAIDGLTFSAEKGEILGFLGPNGAGKTTTMRILCGFMPPTSGKAEIVGFDVIEDSLEVRKRVGYMPETVPLYSDMTVFDYLKFMADLRRLPEPEERVEEVLERVGMEERADGYIKNLSKGMRQRVGLAQAILHEPDVLILDEPTIGLDPAQIIEVRNLIRELGNRHSILLSTHILSEAQQLCDRVLIINRGKIAAEGTPETLRARLTGSQRISMTVRGDSDGLEKVLSSVQGVSQIIATTGDSVEFEIDPSRDARPDVARAVVQAGFDLIELKQVGMSLEEIFLQLTREEPAPPEMADGEFTEGDQAEASTEGEGEN